MHFGSTESNSPAKQGGYPDSQGGYPRFRVRESGHRTFRLATQILHAYRMVHKMNTDLLYKMHGTPGGTIRDPELKIHSGKLRLDLVVLGSGRQVGILPVQYSAVQYSYSTVITGWVGFPWGTEISLRKSQGPSDSLESQFF